MSIQLVSIQLSEPACRKLRKRVWQELESAIDQRSVGFAELSRAVTVEGLRDIKDFKPSEAGDIGEGERRMYLCIEALDCLKEAEQAFDERPSGTAAVHFPEHVVEWLGELRVQVKDRLDELEGGAEDEAARLTCESEAFVLRVLDRIARLARLGKGSRA